MTQQLHCPLCEAPQNCFFYSDARRKYLRCQCCELVFVAPQYYLASAQEKAEYDLHQNNVEDPGYRNFLSRLTVPLVDRLRPQASGLDFGCGPGPALATMLEEQGFQMSVYDVFYQPDSAVLARSYDFICATEVVEHLHTPGQVLAQLWQLLRRGGYLGIMTKLVRDRTAFAGWHYKNDPTHVCFFSDQTWEWWAQENGASLERLGADVILLRRN